jgi:prepilin peptidase CpaA
MFIPLFALLAWAAVVDLRHRRIPNWLTFSLLLSGLCLGSVGMTPAGSLSRAAMGLALGFGLALVPFLLGAWGAGDVKLLAGLGGWIGPLPLLLVFAIAAIGGMIVALWVSARQGKLRGLLRESALITVSAVHGSKLGVFSPQNRASAPSMCKPAAKAVHFLVATVLVLAGAILTGRKL